VLQTATRWNFVSERTEMVTWESFYLRLTLTEDRSSTKTLMTILWYNRMHENCTQTNKAVRYGRENTVVHRLCKGAGNVYKVIRRTNAGSRICSSPRPWHGVDNHSPEELL